jgi:uncharacterized protein YutE (UPF0331/DUF86 family)
MREILVDIGRGLCYDLVMENNTDPTTCTGVWIERRVLDPESTDRLAVCSGCGEWLLITADGHGVTLPNPNRQGG